jgi:hypothetical protein
MQEYAVKQKFFVDNLPPERKDDYLLYKLKAKRPRKSILPTEKINLDESDIKLELHEDNGLTESDQESKSEKEHSVEEIKSPKKTPIKTESNGKEVKAEVKTSELDEFIAKAPRKPEK